MNRVLSIFLLILLTISIIIYKWISSLPATNILADPLVEVTAVSGEEIFWGKGACHVCHRIGERGYALRGPNLGESRDGPLIPIRAGLRARELGLDKGVDYLAQSILQPARYVVSGYKAEMPEVFKAPIRLYPSEIKAVIRYLESLGGDSTFSDVQLPTSYWQGAAQTVFKLSGNVENGRRLFFDSQNVGCASCHTALDAAGKKSGSQVGPDLTSVGSIRTPQALYRKIVKPDSNVVSGYEKILIKTHKGQFFVGTFVAENDSFLILNSQPDGALSLNKNEIARRKISSVTSMPLNYGDLLTAQQIHDIVAFLTFQE